MKTKSALKIIAIFLVIAMTVQDAALAAPAAADWNSWSVHGGKQRLPKVKFSIPEAAGFVAGGYRASGTDAKTVIIIEDAHANPSAQLNAARIIGEIAAADAARTIYTEGAQGDVTLSSLPGGAQADLAQAKALVQKARLSGFELADLTAPGRLRLWGVEDERLYDEALELYRRTADGRAAALTLLDRAERAIDAISGEMFTAQLKELFAARTEHEAGDLSTVRYFERILAAGTEHGVTLSGYKNLGLLRRLVRDESKIDEARLAAEQTEVIGAISAKDQRELGQPDSGLSPVGVLAYWQSARERGALINKGSQLEQYLKYLRRCRKLDAAGVSGELSHLEKTIFNALARSEDARTLLEIIRRFETLRHLLTLQAVPDDFAAYQANRSAYDSARLTAFLNARIHALGRYYDKAVFLDEDFEQAEKNAAAFYQISARRDSAMVSNLVDRMNAADEKQAVLVAGGFHAPGLERELRTRGISYLLVIPAVTHPTDTALYEKRLLAQKAFFRSPSTPTVAALAERAGSEPAKKSLMLRPLSAAARMHDADAIESLKELGISRPDYPAVVSEAPAVAQPANLNPIVSHALDMPVSDHVRELLKSWPYPGKAFGARLAADSKAAGGRTDVLRVIMVSTALVYAAYAVAGIVGGLTAAAAVSAWRGSAGLRLGRIKTAIFALALSAVFLLGALDSRVQELSDFIQLRHLSVEQRRNLMDRYMRIAVENELAYDLFGAPLFGAEHKAAVTSLRLFFAETETSNRHIDQEGGEAVYPEQLEPDTIKTVLIRMFRDDADGHLVSALLQNLQTSGRIDSDFADELQSLSRRVLEERVSKQHDAAVMTDLMQWIHPKLEGTDAGKWNRRQKDFHNLMFHLNLYYEMKTKGLALPDAEDAAEMIHFYKLVWRPGKTILPRLRLKLWKLKPLMRPTAEIHVHPEAVAREFGTRADFADDLDHAFILMGRARNRAQKGEWSGMFWYQGFAGWMLERVQTETRSRSSGQSIMEEEAFIDEARQALEKDRAFYRTRTVPPDWGGARMADHGAAKELHEGARAADQFKYLFADDSRQVLDFVFGDTGVNPEDIEMLETEARGRQGNMRGIRNIRIMKIRKIGDADTKTLFMKFYSAVRDADAASQEILSEVAYHRAITGHFGADAPVIRAMAINDLKSQWASENGIHSLEIQEMAPGGELNREAPFTRILWRQAALSLGRLHQHVFDRDLFVRVGGRRGGPNLAIKRAHVFVDDTPNQERVTFIDLGYALPADTANARHIEVEEELFLDLFEDMFGQGLVDRGEYPDIRSARLDFESEYKRGLADRAEGARMTAAVASRGKYGDEENQDSFLQIDLGEGWSVLAVFDGVGGSEKGAQASQAARDGIKDYFDDPDVRELIHGILTPKLEKSISPLSAVPTPHSEIPLILEDAIARAQEKVRGVKSGDKYSATTALIALVRSDWDVAGNSAAWTINYGDCQSAVWDPSRPDQLRLVGIANMEQGLSKKGQRRLKWNQNYLADLDDAQVISSIYDFEAAALEDLDHSHAEPEDRERLLNHYRRLRGLGIHLPFTWKQAEAWIYRRMTTAIENGQGSFVWPSGVNETRIPPGGVLMLYTDGIGDNLTRREIARVVERSFGASPAPSFRGDWRTPEMRLADDLIWAVHDPTYVIHPMPGKDGSKPEHYSADTRGTVNPRHKRDDATVAVIRNRPTAPPAAARMADHLGSGKMTRRSALAAIAAAVGLRPDRAPGSDAGGRVLSGWSGRVYLLDSGEIVPAGRTLTEGQARVLSADDASLNVSPIWDGECNLLLVRSRSLPGVMGVAHLANGDEARSRAAGFPQRFSRAEVEEQFDGLMGHLAAVGITPEDAKAQLIRYGPSHVDNVVEGKPFMDVWKEVLTGRLGAAPAEREVNPVPRTVGDQAADRHNVMRRMWSNLVRRDDESFEIRSYADAGVLDSYGNEITLVSSQPVLRAEVTPDGLTDKPLISIQEEIWELIAAGATGLTGILLGGYGLSLPVRLLRSRVPINRPNLIGLVRSDLKSLRDSFRSPGSGEGMDRSAARMAAWVDRAIPVVWSNELRQAIRQNSADVHAAASDIIRQLGSMVIENNIRDMNVDAYVKALERGFGNALRARIADITDFESRIIGFYRFMMSSDTSIGYLNGYNFREAQDFRAILAEVLQHEWTQGSDEDALEDEVVSYAADVFSRIVSLQAFENGNHRIGDFVMNFILAKNGFPTFVLTTSNVVEYYRLFNTSALRGKTPADVSGRVSFIRREIRNHTPARIHTARTATIKDGARMAEDSPDTVSETRKLFGQGTRKINKASEDASGDDLRIAGFTDLEHAFLRHQTTAEERHEILEYLLSHLRPPLTTGKADTHAAVQNKDLAESVLHHVLQQMPHQIRIQEFTDIAKIIGRKMMGQNGFSKKFRENIHRQLIFAMMTEPAFVDEVRAFERVAGDSDEHTLAMELMQSYRAIPEELIDLFRAPSAEASVEGIRDWISEHEALITDVESDLLDWAIRMMVYQAGARMADEGPLNNLSSVQYVLATPEEKADILERARQSTIRGKTGYFDRFVTGMRRRLTSEDKKLGQLIGAIDRARPEGDANEWGRSLETRLPHDGVVRSDDGSYWIVKSKGYDSARGDVKNEGRRERLAYLMAERAGVPVAEVRRITPNQAVSLGFQERDAESKYLVRIVERGNYALQRKTNTPASNRSGIWALDLLTRRYDHHIDNYGFAGEETDDPNDPDGGADSMVAVDMDEGLKPKTFIDTDQSTAVMKYTGSHAEHSILMPFETLLIWLGLKQKDIRYDLDRAYQARESGRESVRRWNEAVARLAKKYHLIDAFMEAEGIRPGQIRAAVAHLQAVLDRESILKMAEEAGYSEAEAAGIADWLDDNLKSLDDHAREYWSIMNDEAPLADPAVKEESAGQPSAEGARMAENQASAGRHWDNLIDRSPARADRIKRSILADDPIKRDLEKMGADIDRIFLLPFYGVGQASFGFGRRPLRDGGWDQRSGATHMTAQSDLLKEDMIGLIRRREASGEQRLVLAQAGLGDIQNETADLIELIREAFEAVGAEMDGWDINLILLDLDPAIVDRARDKFGALSGPVRMHYHSIDLLDSAAMDALSERLSIVVRPGVDYFLTRNVFYENTVADAMAAFALPTAGKYEDRLKHWTSASSYAEDGERYGFTQLISLTLALKNIMRYFGRAALGETPGTHYLIDPVPAYERRARAVFAPAGMTSVGDPLLGVLELTDGSQVEGLGLYSAQSGFRVIDTAHSGPEPAAARMAVGMGDWTLDKYVRDLEKRGVDRRVAMAMVEAFDREVREYYADDPDLGQDRLREAINAVDIESIGRLLITSALSGLLFGAAMLFVNGWNLAHSFKTSAVIFGLTILTVNMSRSFEARQSLGPNGTRQFGMFAPNLYYFKGVYVDNCRLMLRKYFDLIEADGGNSGRGSQRPTSGARMSEWEYQPVFARIKPGERTAAFAHRVWQVLTREEPARYFKWADLAMSAGADRESRDTAIMNDEKDVRRLLLSHPDDPLQLELGYGANRDGQLHIPLMRAVAEVLESHARQGVSADEEGLLEDLRLRIRSLFGNARTAEVEIKIRRGLHARPSAHIASFTSELEDEIDARIFFESVDDEEDGPRNASSSADIGGLESEKRVRVTVVSHLSDADADAIHKVYEGLLHASPDSSSYGVEWGPFTSVIDEIASRNPKRSAGARMAEVNERTEPDREALATSLIDHYSMNVDAARQRAEEVRQGSWTRVGNDFVLMDGNGKRAVVVSEMGTRRFFDTNGRWMLTIDPNGNKIDELEWDASGKFKRAWTLNTNFTEVILEPDASDGTISHIRMRVRDEQGVREDVIYDCEPGLDLNRPGEIPYGNLSLDSTILEEDRNGFAVAIFRMLAILVADLGSDARLKYMGDIPSDALYNSLAQVARPDITKPSLADADWSVTDTGFLTPYLSLPPGPRRDFRSSPKSVAWIPDAPEHVFSPHSAMSLSYRNGTLERASYDGIIYKLPQYQTGATSNHAVGVIEGRSDGTYQLIYDRADRQTDIDSAGNILRKITLDEVEDEDTPAEIIWINLTEDDKDLLRTAAARIMEARSERVSSEGGRRLAIGLNQWYAVVGIEQMGGSLILKIGEIVLAEWRDAAALREAAAGVSNPAIATTGQKLADSLMSFDAELIRASDQAALLSLSRKRHFSTWTQVRMAQLLSSDPRTRESELHLFLTAIHWLNTQTSFSDDRYYLDPEDLTKEDLEQIQEFIRYEDTHSIFLGSLDQAELTEHPDVVPAQWYADAQGQMRGWVNILMPSPNEGLMPVGRAKQAAFLAVLGTTDSADETVGARVIFEQADKFDQTIYAEHVVGVYGGSANFGSADQFLGSVRGEIRLIQRLPFHPIRAGARLAKLRETLQQIETMA